MIHQNITIFPEGKRPNFSNAGTALAEFSQVIINRDSEEVLAGSRSGHTRELLDQFQTACPDIDMDRLSLRTGPAAFAKLAKFER